jgi:hypothetical protein
MSRRATESASWTESLRGRVPPWKSLPRHRVRTRVAATIIGLVLAAIGIVFLLSAFGVVGPVYTNCC